MVKLVDNPTDAKEVYRNIGTNGLVSCGSLQAWPSSASEAGTSTISGPYPQLLGQGGMEAAFLDPAGTAGTILEEAIRSNNHPGSRKRSQVAPNRSRKTK